MTRPYLRPLILCSITALLLSACSGAPKETVPPTAAAETTAAPTQAPIDVVSDPTTEAETAADALEEDIPPEPGLVRSPVTHEWIKEELAEKRPIAVMYPIDRKAQPQYGLDRVSVFYEIMEEGSMSRQMGILENWEDLDRIGNIRSIRDYFIYEALEWDSIIVHFGGPEVFVKGMLTRKDVENINGVGGVMGSSYNAFYRIPKNSKSEHTAYTDGQHLLAAIDKAGFSRTHRADYWQPERWKFPHGDQVITLDDRDDAVSAKEINMARCFPVTKTTLSYNEADGKYYRNIYGAPQRDAVSKEQLAFTNVLIEGATSGNRGGSEYLYFHVLDSMKDGYYLTGGKMIHVTWMKNTDYEPTRFFDDSGEEITLNTGKTMVFVVRDGNDSFTADGAEYSL